MISKQELSKVAYNTYIKCTNFTLIRPVLLREYEILDDTYFDKWNTESIINELYHYLHVLTMAVSRNNRYTENEIVMIRSSLQDINSALNKFNKAKF